MKRFWNDVTLAPEGQGHGLRLDGRAVNTPARTPLLLPTPALADAVAQEWRDVAETIDPRAMPLTGLANAAIDRVSPDTAAFARGLAAYGESDLFYYRADTPAELVARQAAQWDPLLDWARARYDVHFEPVAGVMHRAQPEATVTRLGEAVAARNAFELAGLSPLVTIGGSLVGALALLEGAVDREALWRAVQLDEDWQAEKWGADELAVAAQEARKAEFDAAARFLSML